MSQRRTWIAAAAVFCMCGCGASAPIPVSRLGSSESAMRQARANGAEDHQQAAKHLRLAQEELARGRRLVQKGDNKLAERSLMRAEADANVAFALARASQDRALAEQARAQVEMLRRSMAQ